MVLKLVIFIISNYLFIFRCENTAIYTTITSLNTALHSTDFVGGCIVAVIVATAADFCTV